MEPCCDADHCPIERPRLTYEGAASYRADDLEFEVHFDPTFTTGVIGGVDRISKFSKIELQFPLHLNSASMKPGVQTPAEDSDG